MASISGDGWDLVGEARVGDYLVRVEGGVATGPDDRPETVAGLAYGQVYLRGRIRRTATREVVWTSPVVRDTTYLSQPTDGMDFGHFREMCIAKAQELQS